MRLDELMGLRRTVGAGLLVTLTERCPLHCAHCSSASTRAGRLLDGAALLRFLRTFEPDCRPDVLLLTGGEPLTRPRLVERAAEAARAAGTKTAVLSGAFFAAGRSGGHGARTGPGVAGASGLPGSPEAGGGATAAWGLPAWVARVARAVDHFSLSLDAFHEREVARDDVFRTLEALLRTGVATSLHLLAGGPRDPYPDEVAEQVRTRFGADVPMLVATVRPVGRGAALHPRPAAPPAPDPFAAAPCAMAAWPVVAVDGTVTACCNQDVVDGRARPAHLDLGDIRGSSWPEVRARTAALPLLRLIRTVGPLRIAAAGSDAGLDAGRTGEAVPDYCGTCRGLSADPRAREWAERFGEGAVGEVLEAAAARAAGRGGASALVAAHGSARHAHLLDSRPEYGT